MRYLMLSLALVLLAACASPVTVQNPRTGETLTCSTPASEWNPWSQSEACAASHIAQGWAIVR
jgi:hypothetical protein